MIFPKLLSSKPNQTPVALAPVETPGSACFRVLIVEEPDAPASLLAEAVRSEAPEAAVVVTTDLLKALGMASKEACDLLIVATTLSADLGRDLLGRFTERNPQGEVIVTASEAWLGQSPQDATMEGLHMLPAPINPLEMIEILRACRSRANKVVPGVWADEEDGHFVVVLRRHTPVEVVQLKCLSAATTALDFIRPEGVCGRLWFEKGEVVHAEAGSLGGVNAFTEMMNWKMGSIVEISVPAARERTIDVPWTALLMEAAQMADERQAASA